MKFGVIKLMQTAIDKKLYMKDRKKHSKTEQEYLLSAQANKDK